MSDLMELLERVRKATGPDRELERDIMVEAFGDGVRNALPVPTYTASIDAALALVERKLPGWIWMLDKNESGPFDFVLWAETGLRAKANAMGPTAPLAILAALLTALTSGASS